jgi:hypothetical protein
MNTRFHCAAATIAMFTALETKLFGGRMRASTPCGSVAALVENDRWNKPDATGWHLRTAQQHRATIACGLSANVIGDGIP